MGMSLSVPSSPGCDKDLYELGAEEAASIPQVPGSLDAVLDNLERDNEFLTRGGVFTKDLIDTWIAFKRTSEVANQAAGRASAGSMYKIVIPVVVGSSPISPGCRAPRPASASLRSERRERLDQRHR